MTMLFAVGRMQSSPVAVVIVATVIYAASRPIIRWVADKEQNPWLVRILTISLIVHLLAAPAQIYVVNTFYHGIADWIRYDIQGSILAPDFRVFNFTLANANVRGIVNDGSVSIMTGVVMAIVGANQIATFLVFAWFSFLGTVLFYRAFTLTFPGALTGHRRYAYLLFFFPSTIFWTADVSKEAIMTISLGFIAFGCAKVLTRTPGGFLALTFGAVIGAMIRPNELVVVLGGFAVALMVRPSADQRVQLGSLKRIGGLLFMGLLLGVSVYMTLHYLKLGQNGSIDLTQTNRNNAGCDNGCGSSGFVYSSSPFRWFNDAYVILFDPLPFNASGTGQYVAAFENLVIIGVIVSAYRQIRILPRVAFARPYVMMCLVYSIGFIYTFAALGNLGLIYRERTMLLPFFLVIFAFPITPKGKMAMYDWEYKRKDRKAFRAFMIKRDRTLEAMKAAYASGQIPRSPVAPPEVSVGPGVGAPSSASNPPLE